MKEVKYALANSSWDDKELLAIQNVIDSGHYSMGPYVEKFEKEFCNYNGAKYGVMVNSGSSANLLMIAALFYRKHNALKPGDEVIVPAVSWPTTFYPLAQYGLKLKFVDIDKQTLNYDLEALKNAISDKTKLLMVVNLLGNPNDFMQINNLLVNRNIIVVEDNCESLGALFQNKHTGTFGVMGTFSTFFSHHMSTMEGGVIITDDEELYHILLSLRAHGWTRNLPKFNHVCGERSDDLFEESFRFVLPGYNVRPIEMEAAIGLEQLKKLPRFIMERRRNAEYFCKLFKNHGSLDIQQEIGQSSWFGFAFIIKKTARFSRKELVKILVDNGIECRPIVAGNFAKNEVMKYFDYSISGELSNAELIDKNGLFIGNHHFDITEQLSLLYSVLEHYN